MSRRLRGDERRDGGVGNELDVVEEACVGTGAARRVLHVLPAQGVRARRDGEGLGLPVRFTRDARNFRRAAQEEERVAVRLRGNFPRELNRSGAGHVRFEQRVLAVRDSAAARRAPDGERARALQAARGAGGVADDDGVDALIRDLRAEDGEIGGGHAAVFHAVDQVCALAQPLVGERRLAERGDVEDRVRAGHDVAIHGRVRDDGRGDDGERGWGAERRARAVRDEHGIISRQRRRRAGERKIGGGRTADAGAVGERRAIELPLIAERRGAAGQRVEADARRDDHGAGGRLHGEERRGRHAVRHVPHLVHPAQIEAGPAAAVFLVAEFHNLVRAARNGPTAEGPVHFAGDGLLLRAVHVKAQAVGAAALRGNFPPEIERAGAGERGGEGGGDTVTDEARAGGVCAVARDGHLPDPRRGSGGRRGRGPVQVRGVERLREGHEKVHLQRGV